MWHEARRQEKLIRSQMIDSVKRNERRKQFYENVRKDPEQFMQIHGRKCQIHVDPAVARAAEASSILRKWQGDPNVLIDRFDARSHLDYIPEMKSDDDDKRATMDVEELQCEYERYRILVLNEFDRVSEKTFLKEIAAKEFWPDESTSSSIARAELEKKKQLRDKKVAVAFTYGDTQTVQGSSTTELDESDDDDEIVDPDEFDLKVDVDGLDAEQRRNLNKLGIRYGISSGAFSSLLKMDRREQDETHQLKEIEKAKLALAGRQAKAERAVLKKKRALIVGKGCLNEEATTTLLSFVTKNQKEYLESSSSSSSGEDEGTTEFITTFGGDGAENRGEERDDDDADEARMHGPALPSAEFRRIFELKTRRSSSPEDFGSASRSRVRSRSPFPRRIRSRSRERIQSVRSRERVVHRSRSRERRDASRRSRSREKDRRSERARSGSRDKKREEPKSKESRHRSSSNESSGSRLHSHQHRKRRLGGSEPTERRRSVERKHQKRRRKSSSNSSSSRNKTSPSADKRGTGSVLSPSRSNGDTSPLEIRSSMSESEKERIEVENRRRRIRRTAKLHRQQYTNNYPDRSSEDEADRKAALAHKLRTQMQRALRKTAEELKEEERQKHEEHEKERRLREERLFEESLEIRRREREKRRRERRNRSKTSSSSSS